MLNFIIKELSTTVKEIVNPAILIEAKRLLLSSPETVFQYFEKHQDGEIPYQLAEVLLTRNDELINLGLARFTKNKEVLEKLFKESSDEAIRCAALSNPIFFHLVIFGCTEKKHLVNILEKGTQAEVHALVTNESLKGNSLANIFSREGWASHLDDDRWFLCSILALNNPNLQSEYKSFSPVGYGEGWQEYEHDKAIKAAWNLLLYAPLTKKWANGLSYEFSSKKITNIKAMDEKYYKEVLARWVSEKKDLEEDFKDLRMWISSTVPTYLEDLHKWMADHEDRSIRIGHYYSFTTYDEKELDKYYEKDGKEFINAALKNTNLFVNKQIREHLRKLVQQGNGSNISK